MSNDLNLPWKVVPFSEDSEWVDIHDCKGAEVAQCLMPKVAAHIVKCVNNYNTLVAALETVLAAIGYGDESDE